MAGVAPGEQPYKPILKYEYYANPGVSLQPTDERAVTASPSISDVPGIEGAEVLGHAPNTEGGPLNVFTGTSVRVWLAFRNGLEW